MTRHIDDSMLQDFREGFLEPGAEAEVREHLEVCSQCRDGLEALTELLEGLGGLPTEAQPSRDLWPQIAWRIEGSRTRELTSAHVQETVGGEVGDSETQRGPSRVGRRISLPAWQLLAASIALMVISGGTVLAFLSGRMDPASSSSPISPSPGQFVAWEEAYGGYDEAVADLEAVLDRGREVLDPETVRVLEENLETIDRALQEAEDALMQDPASAVLQRFLADMLRRKMDLLRKAAGAVYATT
jgi:hypothetical protein